MNRLSDGTIHHLRNVMDTPEVPGGRYEILEPVGEGGMGRVYLSAPSFSARSSLNTSDRAESTGRARSTSSR